MPKLNVLGWIAAFAMIATVAAHAADAPAKAGSANDEQREADKKALQPLKGYVGEWKGVGGGRGDSAKDSWGEESDWGWDFKNGRAAVSFTSANGHFYTAGRIEPSAKGFHFVGTLPDKKTKEEFTGDVNKDGDLILTNDNAPAGRPTRLTLSLVAKGARMVTTYEKSVRKGTYAPMAEVGLTLKGSGFGKAIDMRECVVTGGRGKTPVQYKGQTYYVCCGGCADEFNENPDKVMAAWKKRKEEEMKK
jgi:YHS domain-containing protein